MSVGTDAKISSSASNQQEEQTIRHLFEFIKSPLKEDEDSKKREDAIIDLGNILSRSKRTNELCQMIEITRPFLVTLGKAKAARMVRDLVDLCLKIDQDGDIKVGFVEESIQWAKEQNHNFLRQSLQSRLVRLFNDLQRYAKALDLAVELIHELKKVDDKDLLMEVQLEESKSCYYLGNLSKARASLVSARTIANSMYVSPVMQASLDVQSGILHAADERDFQTAFSYFYEAFESFNLANQEQDATLALKYMLLCKVMLDKPEDIPNIMSQKGVIKYHGDEINSIIAIGKASKNRSLKEFNEAFEKYRKELQCDAVIRKHFNTLSESMLEKELCRLIEPYSAVQISHIADKIGLSVQKVEKALARMILEKKLYGSLHQADGILIVYPGILENDDYDLAVQSVHAISKVIDVLYKRAQVPGSVA